MRTPRPVFVPLSILGSSAILSAFILALVFFLASPTQAPAQAGEASPAAGQSPLPPPVTTVSSDIAADTTWTLANSPYQVTSDITVLAGATLTIEPGVEVRFEQYRGLTVGGRLIAQATASQPITFTGTTQQPGWWDGLSMEGTAEVPISATLSYVTIEYGGYRYANLDVTQGVVTVTNSLLRGSSRDGLYTSNDGVAHVSDSSFLNNQRYALFFNDGSVNPSLARLTFSGNGYDAIAMSGGTLSGSHTWESLGAPYIVRGEQTVAPGATLTIEPGVEVRFEQYRGLTVGGRLITQATASQPITFTGTTPAPGWWDGIDIQGSSSAPEPGATFDYVTVEYGGGRYANLYVSYGRAAISHSIIRHSSKDGLYAGAGGGGSTIESSQIVNNDGYGVRNEDSKVVLMASNNWWGTNTGPSVTGTACNPNGTGSTVSARVEFRPFLTLAGADPGPLAGSEARLLSLTPQRWFVPADGVIRAWVTITLRSGGGQPLPGRQTRLRSTLGTVVDGGLTNAEGKSLAYVTSTTPGEAELTTTLDLESACETARSATAKVTFTPVAEEADLLPEAAAPYLNHRIEIDPEPITQGVPTTLRARLTNPNNFPISVNATFGIAQYGLGLAFGPVGEVQNQVLPANSEGVVQVVWTPPISGHYCIRVEYSYQASSGVTAAVGKSGSAQRNVDVRPGRIGSTGEKDMLGKGRKATGGIGKLPAGGKGVLFIPKTLVMWLINWAFDTTAESSQALGGDPPRGDYRTIATPQKPSVAPVQPDSELSAARAAAINALVDALLDVMAYGRAALISNDRYGGASAARDEYWAAQQAAALVYYKKQMGTALVTSGDRLDAFLQVLRNEGVADVAVTADDLRAYQNRLRTQGFSAEEAQAARDIALTDAEIEAMRQRILAANPEAEAVSSLMSYLASLASTYRQVGNVLANPQNFPAATGVRASATATNNLARVYGTTSSVVVGNPLTQTATISMTVRRVDMPPDWAVAVTPVSVTLSAGSQTTVTVTVEPGSAAVQGTQPRAAIEGYAGDQFLGGVALDVLVPRSVAFDGKLRVYIPISAKAFSGGW